MRPTWILGVSFAAVIAAGCGGADQNSSGNTGGTAGSAGSTSTGGGNTGGSHTGGSHTGGATGGSHTGGSNTGGAIGGSHTGGATGGSTTGGAGGCGLITEDASKIGADCGNGGNCPTGYTCHEFHGITVTNTCQILCDQDCECPPGTTCVMRSDKTTSWKECAKP